jgi:hypothetical protein
MRWTILIVYCLVIGLADAVIMWLRPAPPALSVVAAREMPANWRLEPGDLKLGGAAARYTTAALHAEQSVEPSQIAIAPNVVADSGAVLVALPLTEESGPVNAGSTLLLCQGTKVLLDQLAARTKICAPGGACQVLLNVPADKSALLAAFKTSPPPVLRPSAKGCGA